MRPKRPKGAVTRASGSRQPQTPHFSPEKPRGYRGVGSRLRGVSRASLVALVAFLTLSIQVPPPFDLRFAAIFERQHSSATLRIAAFSLPLVCPLVAFSAPGALRFQPPSLRSPRGLPLEPRQGGIPPCKPPLLFARRWLCCALRLRPEALPQPR